MNIYLAGVVASPDGKDVYLFLDDNQNSTLYPDYRAMTGTRCILYKVVKSTGVVSCLMDNTYAISNPGRNPVEYGNRAEPYIKFDASGNLFIMAYKPNGGGSIGYRLYKIPVNGSPVIVRDFVDSYYGQNVVYAKNGNLFYTEVDEAKPSYKSRSFIFDTASGSFNKINALDDQYIAKIATSLDGNVYVKTDSNTLYRVNQSTYELDNVIVNDDTDIIELTRNPSGCVYIEVKW